MWRKWALRWRSLFVAARVDLELDQEVQFHVEQQAAEFMRQGVPEDEAVRRARRQFGNATLHKEECRDTRNVAWFENAWQDVRIGWRSLRRSSGFTVVSVLTLALGIGATTVMYSVLDHTVLHPVGMRDADHVVWLQELSKAHEESGGNPARLRDWQTAHSFSAVCGSYGETLVWASTDGPVSLAVLRLFGDAGGVLQPELQTGRNFTAAEMRGEGQPVAILTARAFQQRFHSDAALVHQPLRLAGASYQIVGVLAANLDFPEDVDLWTPAPAKFPSRQAGFLDLLARLKPGVSLVQAQAEMNVISARLAREYPATDAGRSARLTLLPEYIGNAARRPMLLLFASVASLLLIGCLNIAGLVLARALVRRREAAIRVSLGAGQARLARLFFSESLLLALTGCAGGLAFAFASIDLLKANLPAYVPNVAAIRLDAPVVWFAVALALVTALIFGTVPAWQFARGAQNAALKEGGAGSAGVSRSRVRSLLVVAQVALSVVVLVAAALLVNSFRNVVNRPLGFNTAQAYTFRLNLPWDSKQSEIDALSARTLERLNALPGTVATGVVDRIPLHGGSQSGVLVVRGKTLPPDLAEREFRIRTASAGSFVALGIPLRAGELFQDWQAGHGAQEAVISDRLAALLFPHEDPLGQEIAQRVPGEKAPDWFRIVGVVGSMPFSPIDREPAAELYIPWGATFWPVMNFVVRSERPVRDLAMYVRSDLQKLDPGGIFTPVLTLDEQVAETRSAPRTAALLLSGFALAALALVALGIFGLMTQEANRKMQEIGVRLALGAKPTQIAGDSLLDALKLFAWGLAIGLLAAWYAAVYVQSLLFEIAPHHAVSFVTAGLVLLAAGVLASLGPAMRAARTDPMRALRHE